MVMGIALRCFCSWQVWICVVQENGRAQATKSALEGIVSQSANYLRDADAILPTCRRCLGIYDWFKQEYSLWGWLFICLLQWHGLWWRDAFVGYHLEVEMQPVSFLESNSMEQPHDELHKCVALRMDGLKSSKCGDDVIESHVFTWGRLELQFCLRGSRSTIHLSKGLFPFDNLAGLTWIKLMVSLNLVRSYSRLVRMTLKASDIWTSVHLKEIRQVVSKMGLVCNMVHK